VETCWSVLQIEQTLDKKLIKKAYARLLKMHKPEQDPVGYQRVREAYDAAIAFTVNPSIAPILQNTVIDKVPVAAKPLKIDNPEIWANKVVNELARLEEGDKVACFTHVLDSCKGRDLFYRRALSTQLLFVAYHLEISPAFPIHFFNLVAEQFDWFEVSHIDHLEAQRFHVLDKMDEISFFSQLAWASAQPLYKAYQKHVFIAKVLLSRSNRLLFHVICFFNFRVSNISEVAKLLNDSSLYTYMKPRQKVAIQWWARTDNFTPFVVKHLILGSILSGAVFTFGLIYHFNVHIEPLQILLVLHVLCSVIVWGVDVIYSKYKQVWQNAIQKFKHKIQTEPRFIIGALALHYIALMYVANTPELGDRAVYYIGLSFIPLCMVLGLRLILLFVPYGLVKTLVFMSMLSYFKLAYVPEVYLASYTTACALWAFRSRVLNSVWRTRLGRSRALTLGYGVLSFSLLVCLTVGMGVAGVGVVF